MGISQVLLFSCIVMCAYFIEGLIGFGGTIMAIPLASAVLGLRTTIPVLTIVVLIASIIIAVRDRKHIDKKQFIKITALMILGLPIGMWLFDVIPERPLKVALGIFMIYVGIKGLYDSKKSKTSTKEIEIDNTIGVSATTVNKELVNSDSKFKKLVENLTIFCGGIVHGAFTCGGPFVVVYATKNIRDKSSFRATLCALWATLNGIIFCMDLYSGQVTADIIKISAITMLFVVVAIVTSNIVHKKIKGDAFTKFVYVALIVSGILMAR